MTVLSDSERAVVNLWNEMMENGSPDLAVELTTSEYGEVLFVDRSSGDTIKVCDNIYHAVNWLRKERKERE